MRLITTLLAVTVVCALGCETAEKPAPPAPSKVICTLRFRDGLIDIRTGPGGQRFDVLDAEGKVLAAGLDEGQLRAKYPAHFEALEKGLTAEGGPVFEASGGALRAFPLDARR